MEELKLTEEHNEAIPTETINTNIKLQLRFNKVTELHSQGYTLRAISRCLYIPRVIIRKYIRMEFLPKKKSSRSRNFESYQQFLLHESNWGKLYTELYAAILREGFKGRYTQFCSNMNELFENNKIIPASRKIDPPVAMRTWSPGKLSIMIQKDTKNLNKEDRKFLQLLCDKSPVIKKPKNSSVVSKNYFKTKKKVH